MVRVEQFAHLLILVLNMVKVFLTGIEIVLILATIVSSITTQEGVIYQTLNYYYFCIMRACSVKNFILLSILT